MAVKTVGYIGTPWSGTQTQDTERGPSPSIWYQQGTTNAWWASFIQDPRLGLAEFDDFKGTGISPATGSAANFNSEQTWYAYLDTNGVITDSGIVGGGVNLAASTTANQGVALGSLTNSYQIVTSGGVQQGRLAFECRVQCSTASVAASKSDVFLGLVDASGLPASAVPITNTGGTLASAAGFIGFHKRGGATNGADFNFVFNVAGGTPQYFTQLNNIVKTVTGTAMAGATFYKLGFVFNPNAESIVLSTANALTGETAGVLVTPSIYVYVNGVPAAAVITKPLVIGTTFPTTLMSPAIAFKQQSTTAAVSADVDWIMVAQQLIA